MAQANLSEGAAPSTPSSGTVALYAKTDGLLYSKDDAGLEKSLGGIQIQPISASVGASALTISASALLLDFRSATLASGTVTTVSGTPASLVISSGSTLGTVSAVQSRIVIIALNNAGTIELAAVNAACGLSLDETGVISTTAEGGAGGADSATVVYSTTARTNVSYRVIGYLVSTQATAGTWATAPSTIQGAGGVAVMLSTRTTQIFTSGSGTYTTPTGCKAINVRMVGSGSGGGGGNAVVSSTAGGDTTFGSLTAGGGPAATVAGVANASGGTATGGDINISGGGSTQGIYATAVHSGAGSNGASTVFGAGTPGSYNGAAIAAAANSGAGGGGGGANNTTTAGGQGGASGGYVEKLISSPAATYSYAVGAGGAAAAAGAGGSAGSAGAAGIIIVEEFY